MNIISSGQIIIILDGFTTLTKNLKQFNLEIYTLQLFNPNI